MKNTLTFEEYNLIDNSECYYCGVKSSPLNRQLEHVVPTSRGGENTRDNVVSVCSQCNNSKNNYLVFEWLSKLHPKIAEVIIDNMIEKGEL